MIDTSILRSGRLECHISFSIPLPNERRVVIEGLLKKIHFQNESEKKMILDWIMSKTSYQSIAMVKSFVERIIVKYVTEQLSELTFKYVVDNC